MGGAPNQPATSDDSDATGWIPARVQPQLKRLNLLQVARAARENLLSIVPGIAYRQPIVSGRMVIRWHMLTDPASIRRVLVTNHENYPRSKSSLRLLRPAIGESLFVAKGHRWHWQRRVVAPLFKKSSVDMLVPAMQAPIDRMICELEASVGKTCDIYRESVKLTFDVICDVALSSRDSLDRQAFLSDLDNYLAKVGRVSLFDVLDMPDWLPRPANFMARGRVARLRKIASELVRERREVLDSNVTHGTDLLDLMIRAVDPVDGAAMSTSDIRDNLLTFVVAGHETTALAISWSIYLLAGDPEAQARARDEAKAACGNGSMSVQSLAKIPYVSQVVDEAMRLYPPVPLISRDVLAHDSLAGREIKPRDMLLIPVYALHRHQMLWEKPDHFIPDRFSLARRAELHKYQYIPFGAGPRVCIGSIFALQEAKMAICSLLAKLRFSLVPSRHPEPVAGISLRPKSQIELRVDRA